MYRLLTLQYYFFIGSPFTKENIFNPFTVEEPMFPPYH